MLSTAGSEQDQSDSNDARQELHAWGTVLAVNRFEFEVEEPHQSQVTFATAPLSSRLADSTPRLLKDGAETSMFPDRLPLGRFSL